MLMVSVAEFSRRQGEPSAILKMNESSLATSRMPRM